MAERSLFVSAIPVNQVPDVDAAYLAGMIDADGFISIQRTLKENRGRCDPVICHCLKVGIAGTSQEPHGLAASHFGGNIARYVPKNPKHLPQFQWQASGPIAVIVLEVIFPFLRIKRRQAVVGLAFQSMLVDQIRIRRSTQIPPYRITKEMRDRRDEFWTEMQSLNKWRSRGKKAAGRLLDGREWNEFPKIAEVSHV